MLNNVKTNKVRAKTPTIDQLSNLLKLLKHDSKPFPKLETTRYKESYNYKELKQGFILKGLPAMVMPVRLREAPKAAKMYACAGFRSG